MSVMGNVLSKKYVRPQVRNELNSPSHAALVVQRQLHERDVVEWLVLAGARRPHFQQKQVLVAVVRQHLVVNFGRNPARRTHTSSLSSTQSPKLFPNIQRGYSLFVTF